MVGSCPLVCCTITQAVMMGFRVVGKGELDGCCLSVLLALSTALLNATLTLHTQAKITP